MALGIVAVFALPGPSATPAAAAPREVQAERGAAASGIAETIRRRVFDWAIAFNEGRTEALCDLFSEDLRARVRGEPVRGREAMCDQFRRTATDPATTLTYAPSVEDVLAGEDLVVAEVTWLLRVERGVVDTRFIERTQYVFRREGGAWRVVRLMSYVEPDDR